MMSCSKYVCSVAEVLSKYDASRLHMKVQLIHVPED